MIPESIRRVFTGPAFTLRDYRKLWFSSLFNMMGAASEVVIAGYLVYQLTGSTAWVGFSLALYFGPMLLFGVPAGVLADSIQRKKLLPACEFGLVVLLGSYAVFLIFQEASLLPFLAILFISGTIRAIHFPVRASYVYDLVGRENIVSSLGLLNLGTRTGQLAGAAMAGLALKYSGPALAFGILAAAHIIALGTLTGLANAGRSADFKPAPVLEQLAEYGRELASNRALQLVIGVTIAIEIFGFSFITALPELAASKLEVGADGLGFMHAARAVGGMLAGFAFATTINLGNKGRIYMAVSCGFGLAVIGLGLSPNLGLALLAIAGIAAMAASTDVLSQSMMQMVVPDRLRGRAMGAWVFAVGLAPVGHIVAGLLAERFGADTAMLMNGIALLIITLLVLLAVPRKFRDL